MNIYDLTSESIRYYLPNILTEVAGETPIVEKLSSYIASAKEWLENEYLGPDDFLDDAHNAFAMKILVVKAFADAVPALDIVITPTGMAVINTDNMAPASKERVERLIASLRSYVKTNLPLLVDICKGYPQWRQSERGRYFCSTFLSLADCDSFSESVSGTFDVMRGKCIIIERELTDRYFGTSLMDRLRDDYHSGTVSRSCSLISALRSAILELLRSPEDGGKMRFYPNAMWHICRPVVNELNYYPDYKTLWEEEMSEKFNIRGFVNDIKGGFYF